MAKRLKSSATNSVEIGCRDVDVGDRSDEPRSASILGKRKAAAAAAESLVTKNHYLTVNGIDTRRLSKGLVLVMRTATGAPKEEPTTRWSSYAAGQGSWRCCTLVRFNALTICDGLPLLQLVAEPTGTRLRMQRPMDIELDVFVPMTCLSFYACDQGERVAPRRPIVHSVSCAALVCCPLAFEMALVPCITNWLKACDSSADTVDWRELYGGEHASAENQVEWWSAYRVGADTWVPSFLLSEIDRPTHPIFGSTGSSAYPCISSSSSTLSFSSSSSSCSSSSSSSSSCSSSATSPFVLSSAAGSEDKEEKVAAEGKKEEKCSTRNITYESWPFSLNWFLYVKGLKPSWSWEQIIMTHAGSYSKGSEGWIQSLVSKDNFVPWDWLVSACSTESPPPCLISALSSWQQQKLLTPSVAAQVRAYFKSVMPTKSLGGLSADVAAFRTNEFEREIKDPTFAKLLFEHLEASDVQNVRGARGLRRLMVTQVVNPALWSSYVMLQRLGAEMQTYPSSRSKRTISEQPSPSLKKDSTAPSFFQNGWGCPHRTACRTCESARSSSSLKITEDETSDPPGLMRAEFPSHAELVFHGATMNQVGDLCRRGFQGDSASAKGTCFSAESGFSLQSAVNRASPVRTFGDVDLPSDTKGVCAVAMVQMAVGPMYIIKNKSQAIKKWSLDTTLASTALEPSSSSSSSSSSGPGRLFLASPRHPAIVRFLVYYSIHH